MVIYWDSPRALEVTSFVYKQLVVFLVGFYIWDYMDTVWFEWLLISRKLTFKWYYASYLIGRYSMLCVLCTLFAIDRILEPINCRVVHPLLTTLGLVASACATTNLMIRTVIIWNYHLWVMVPLGLLSCGQMIFSLYAGTTYAVAYWDPALRTCLFEYEHYSHMASVFIYTVAYDLLILILTCARIWWQGRGGKQSRVLGTMLSQGILYFVATSVVNIIAAVIIWLHLNDGMNAVVSPPATTISVILSSHSVISLFQSQPSGGVETPNSARKQDRSSGTKYGSEHLTSQLDLSSAIYGSSSCDLPGGPSSLSQPSISSVQAYDIGTSTSLNPHKYPPSPALLPPVASSSKL